METEVKDVNNNLTANAEGSVDEAVESFENDSDVQRLKAQEAELMNMMSLISDPNVMRAYKDARAVGERRQVSQKEKKKKKAKRRMAKKSKR
jgi:hypothetical protein